MSKIEKFEDLICWQKAGVLTKRIYEVSNRNSFQKDFSLKDQIRRAALSVILNIAEGFGRRTHNEFKYFLYISNGSIAEVQSCLYIAGDLNYIDEVTFQKLYLDSTEVSKIIFGLIKSLK